MAEGEPRLRTGNGCGLIHNAHTRGYEKGSGSDAGALFGCVTHDD